MKSRKFLPKNSREEACPEMVRGTAKSLNVYQGQNRAGNKIDFVIVNLMTQVPVSDLNLVLNAVKQYCDNGFAPVWGTTATFTLLDYGKFPETTDGKAIIYLVDQLSDAGQNFGQSIAIHYLVLPDDESGEGQPPIDGIPPVPVSTPVIIIPYGDGSYGLSAVLSLDNNFSLINVLGTALSHEVFETLVDPFPMGYGASYQVFVGPTSTHMYVKEVCDPVESSSTVNVNGVELTNFVFPSYFNPLTKSGTQLDYKNLVTSPLTPYKGLQFGLLIDGKEGGMALFVDQSPEINPTKVSRFILNEIYHPCTARSIMRHMKHKIRLDGNLADTNELTYSAQEIRRVVFEK
jgi:hypothetical protein